MYKIFALDDDQEVLNQLKVFTKEMNLELIVQTNPIESLKTLSKESNFDLIIVDVNMPEMDGFTFAQKINESKSFARVPIIFLTASNSIEDVKKATAIGASGYIIKPLVKKALVEKLDSFFNTHIRIIEPARLKKISEDSFLSIESSVEIILIDDQCLVIESLDPFPLNAKYEFKTQAFKQIRIESLSVTLKSQMKNEERNVWISEFKIDEIPTLKSESYKALLKLWKNKPSSKN